MINFNKDQIRNEFIQLNNDKKSLFIKKLSSEQRSIILKIIENSGQFQISEKTCNVLGNRLNEIKKSEDPNKLKHSVSASKIRPWQRKISKFLDNVAFFFNFLTAGKTIELANDILAKADTKRIMDQLPIDVMTLIIQKTGESTKLAALSKNWQKASRLAISSTFKSYYEKKPLKPYIKEALIKLGKMHDSNSLDDICKHLTQEEEGELVNIVYKDIFNEFYLLINIQPIKKSAPPDAEYLVNLTGSINKHKDLNLIILTNEVLNELFNLNLNENENDKINELKEIKDFYRDPKHKALKIRKWMQKNSEMLKQIKELRLQDRNITILPKEIEYFTGLTKLNVSGNKLSSLPAEIGSLTQLQSLFLNHNKLTSLPKEIGSLTQLQNLNLKNNELKSLPSEIGFLTQLQVLNLPYNKLTSLPKEIGSLTQLEYLRLGCNELKSLPSEIGSLINLEVLEIYGNNLKPFPAELKSLKKLKNLNTNFP